MGSGVDMANEAADRVREVIVGAMAQAEHEAEQIRRRALTDAARIREGAEAEMRDRIGDIRARLEEVGAALSVAPLSEGPAPGRVASQPDVTRTAHNGNGNGNGRKRGLLRPRLRFGTKDSALVTARVVATTMALDGATKEELDDRLRDLEPADREAIIDDVLTKAGR